MERLPFVEKIICPRVCCSSPDIYMGMGFVGKDGQFSIGLGLDFLLFLFMGREIGDHLQAKERIVFLMDKPFGHDLIDVSPQEALIQKVMELLKMEDWKIIKFSDLLKNPVGDSYEEVQSKITAQLLPRGGYQVGWLYPDYKTYSHVKLDELYFAKMFQNYFPERNDIGFVFGKFPSIIPSYTPGPPYLVKTATESRRVLLVEKEDSLMRKLSVKTKGRQGEPVKLKRSKMEPIFRVFSAIGLNVNGDPPTETFLSCMEQIGDILGSEYQRAF